MLDSLRRQGDAARCRIIITTNNDNNYYYDGNDERWRRKRVKPIQRETDENSQLSEHQKSEIRSWIAGEMRTAKRGIMNETWNGTGETDETDKKLKTENTSPATRFLQNAFPTFFYIDQRRTDLSHWRTEGCDPQRRFLEKEGQTGGNHSGHHGHETQAANGRGWGVEAPPCSFSGEAGQGEWGRTQWKCAVFPKGNKVS